MSEYHNTSLQKIEEACEYVNIHARDQAPDDGDQNNEESAPNGDARGQIAVIEAEDEKGHDEGEHPVNISESLFKQH